MSKPILLTVDGAGGQTITYDDGHTEELNAVVIGDYNAFGGTEMTFHPHPSASLDKAMEQARFLFRLATGREARPLTTFTLETEEEVRPWGLPS